MWGRLPALYKHNYLKKKKIYYVAKSGSYESFLATGKSLVKALFIYIIQAYCGLLTVT
jgi:hypothetical protein